jgi:hypothetical protein
VATIAENLETAINAILVAIAANPTAVSYNIDGQSVNRSEMDARLKMLVDMRDSLSGPVEVVSYGVV